MGLSNFFAKTSLAKHINAVKSAPREVCFNKTLLLTAFFYAQAAVTVTWDQGQASVVPSLPGFQKHFGISSGTDASAIRNFVSLVYVGDGVGAALSYFLNDRLGRLWSFRLYTCVYMIGMLVATFAPNTGALYASRIITGLGIGSLSATAPLSIAEIAPGEVRGMLTAWYPTAMGLALLAANFCVYGVHLHIPKSNLQFQIVWFAPIIYMSLVIIGSFFVTESPRWLMLKDRQEEACAALAKFRNLPMAHPRVQQEMEEMRDDIHKSSELYTGSAASNFVATVKETFLVPENLRRVQQAMILFAFPQLSGANAITSYLVPILKIIGASGSDSRNIFLSGMYSMSKFFFSLITSLLLIDLLGRRKSLFIGITTQMLTDVYIAVYVNRRQAGVDVSDTASRGAIAMIYLHAFGYAAGLFILPYVFGGELWPNRIRSFGASLSQSWHWFFHYGMTTAAPSLLKSMDNWGAFVFYASWCSIALIYVYLVVPEIASLSLEEMNEVFRGPWFKAYQQTKKRPIDGQSVDENTVESQKITMNKTISNN